jgi:hypothetical protein
MAFSHLVAWFYRTVPAQAVIYITDLGDGFAAIQGGLDGAFLLKVRGPEFDLFTR